MCDDHAYKSLNIEFARMIESDRKSKTRIYL